MKAPESAQVLEFLKRHVIGRAVIAPPVTTHTDHGQVTGAYEEDAIYSNLVVLKHGFAFDLTTLTRGTRYVADKGGHLLAEGTLNAVRVIRYEMTERASTHRLVGYARIISSTNSEPDPFAGVVFLVHMAMDHGALVVHETMLGYADFPAADGCFKPGAVNGRYRYAIEHGKLTVCYDQERFDVDATSLKRTPAGDKFPTQVSHEITFPNPDLDRI